VERLTRLCDFTNGAPEGVYVPPALRAIITHFMLAYDHPFVDGNGRTARALFYYSMLNQGYWLVEFVSISRLLKAAPAQYGRSFLYSEDDEGDLTYFVIHQLELLQRAISDLHAHVQRKADKQNRLRAAIGGRVGVFNERQLAVLQYVIEHRSATLTVSSHAASHNVVLQTARNDLGDLEGKGLLAKIRQGRGYAWTAVEGLDGLLRE